MEGRSRGAVPSAAAGLAGARRAPVRLASPPRYPLHECTLADSAAQP